MCCVVLACDIIVKGVNFYGPHSEYVVTGSDCGNVFLWDKRSADIVNFFHADDGGVVRSNIQWSCVEHNNTGLMAFFPGQPGSTGTSGINNCGFC